MIWPFNKKSKQIASKPETKYRDDKNRIIWKIKNESIHYIELYCSGRTMCQLPDLESLYKQLKIFNINYIPYHDMQTIIGEKRNSKIRYNIDDVWRYE